VDLARTPGGRRFLFAAYYFVEGAPIGFLWWSLPSLLRAAGVGPERIGALLGWLVLPWALKWLWAPAIDRAQGRRWTLRAWIGTAQAGMVATLAPLLLVEQPLTSAWLPACLVAHAVFAATQDAAIDALMIRTTAPGERGVLAGWMQVGLLGGRSLLGGGALLVLAQVGGRALVAALLAVVLAGLALLPLYRAPLPGRGAVPARCGDDPPPVRVGAALARLLARRTPWVGLAFALLGGAGFEALGAFAGPLLTDLAGGDTTAAGRFFLLPAVAATAVGGLLGGRLADRAGERRAAALAGPVLGATLLAAAGASASAVTGAAGPGALVPWLALVYAAIGAFTTASYALFMRWTDPRLGATGFSAFMGATNACESWSAAAAGRMIPHLGYGRTFSVMAAVGLLSLFLLPFARRGSTRRSPRP